MKIKDESKQFCQCSENVDWYFDRIHFYFQFPSKRCKVKLMTFRMNGPDRCQNQKLVVGTASRGERQVSIHSDYSFGCCSCRNLRRMTLVIAITTNPPNFPRILQFRGVQLGSTRFVLIQCMSHLAPLPSLSAVLLTPDEK